MRETSKPTIIDEDGVPVVDATTAGTSGGLGGTPGGMGGAAGGMGGAAGGMRGAPMPGLPPFPEELLGRNGKPSLIKIIGWKGVAVLVLLVAGMIALAIASLAVAVIVVPILLLIGAVGWVVAKVRGPKRPAASSSTVLVIRR